MPAAKKNSTKLAALLLLGGGLFFLAKGLMIPAKAYLSVHFINYAWEQTIEQQKNVKPWPWMDSTPVARLSFPAQGKSFVVLRGTSGMVLAFSPGWHEQTDLPGQGVSLISAHRDTHFSVLKNIKIDSVIEIQTKSNEIFEYQIVKQFVTDSPHLSLPQGAQDNLLILVTCYPLDSWSPHSKQRYIIVAEKK